MIKDYDTGKRSIGSIVAQNIIDLAEQSHNSHILEEISISGLSDIDGSATLSFEWVGDSSTSSKPSEIIDFFNDIKNLIINTKKEVVEQVSPSATIINGVTRIIYRFRIWDEAGKYEVFEKELVIN